MRQKEHFVATNYIISRISIYLYVLNNILVFFYIIYHFLQLLLPIKNKNGLHCAKISNGKMPKKR